MRQKIQIILVLGILAAGVRLAYIFYERHEEAAVQPAKAPVENNVVNADFYVTPRRLHPSDLVSAKQLTRQPVWVKEGYRYSYYPYNRAEQKSDFAHEAGQLLPIQKLKIDNVVYDRTPGAPDQRQIMALFQYEGRSFAVPIGYSQGGHTLIYSDEMFFIQDPRELYHHWPSDVWDAIEKHEVKSGMNELQADFAIGFGIPDDAHQALNRKVHYSNGGKPVTVTYRDGRAVEVTAG